MSDLRRQAVKYAHNYTISALLCIDFTSCLQQRKRSGDL